MLQLETPIDTYIALTTRKKWGNEKETSERDGEKKASFRSLAPGPLSHSFTGGCKKRFIATPKKSAPRRHLMQDPTLKSYNLSSVT